MTALRRQTDKFSCSTSRFLLPTFRRPCYRELTQIHVQCEPASQLFAKWTEEDGTYYNTINTALLNDDYEVLKNNIKFINSLRIAIQNTNANESLIVYRNLNISSELVKEEYKIGLQFLWPTFTCTSRNRDVTHTFGNYTFEIAASENDWTYRTDISKYSVFPDEQEVLFYPYSGFVVKDVMYDAKVIRLKSMDTLKVESKSKKLIPEQIKIFDASRNMLVYMYKNSSDIHWSYADKPNQKFLIGQNQKGYWDSPYRYHHCNGYFVDKGDNIWEEYQGEKLHARFVKVQDGDN